MPDSTAFNSKPPRRRWAFRLTAVLCGLLPFVLLELTLRAFDVGRPTELSDPFVGFSDKYPQFELDEENGQFVTSKSRRLFFGTERFAAKKPDNGYRVFCLGGSTVRGRPYTIDSAFARWMQVQLSACDPDTRYEVINCGGLSYASYRLRRMTEEVLKYEPDLIVIATGHNEFLEDRSYGHIKNQSETRRAVEESVYNLRIVTAARQLFGDKPGAVEDNRPQLKDQLKTRLDQATGYASYKRDDEWSRQVQEHFRFSLRAMVKMCGDADVPIVFVRLGSNLRDCPPFKSEHRPGLAESDRANWQTLFDKAAGLDRKNVAEALKLYQQAAKIDDEHALLCYRIARCHDRLKQFKQAEKFYRRAKDLDVCPLRILDAMADDVTKIAKETNTPLVDAATMLEEQSRQGIPGNDLYMDHVHPTIYAHQRIARELVDLLREKKKLPKGYRHWNGTQRRAAYERHFIALGPTHFAGGKIRVGWLENWARRKKHEKEAEPIDARGMLHNGHRRFNLGEVDMAWKEYMNAYRLSPTIPQHLLFQALRLFQQGRFEQVDDFLEKLRTIAEPPLRHEVDLARLILAIETGNKPTALGIARDLGGDIMQVPKNSAWHQLMPDALNRAAKLAPK